MGIEASQTSGFPVIELGPSMFSNCINQSFGYS